MTDRTGTSPDRAAARGTAPHGTTPDGTGPDRWSPAGAGLPGTAPSGIPPAFWWASGLALLLAMVLGAAWVSDDAYITFRAVDQWLCGHGPRWNPHERVQVFSHPAWFALLAAGGTLWDDLYGVALVLSAAATAGTAVLLRRLAPGYGAWFLGLVILVGSKAFVEFSTGGLENPLLHLLLAAFLLRSFAVLDRGGGPRDLSAAAILAGLAILTRHDAVAILAPSVLALLLAGRPRASVARAAALGLALPLAWTAFAVAWYGFPLPNPAYAKTHTGAPWLATATQAGNYLWNSLAWDPWTLAVVAAGFLAAVRSRRGGPLAAMAGVGFHLAYLSLVGGDFMTGRFLAAPFLVSATVLVHCAPALDTRRGAALVAVLACLFAASPRSPWRQVAPVAPLHEDGVTDERWFHESLQWTARLASTPANPFPDHAWCRGGEALRQSPDPVAVEQAVGLKGYCAGTAVRILDRMGLGDPLLARQVPERPDCRPGHCRRAVPEGLVEAIATDDPGRVQDPAVREALRQLWVITRGPLWTAERWRLIARWNLRPFAPLAPDGAAP